ncbi:AbiU2 domain-containing protein [Porticoccus sp.]
MAKNKNPKLDVKEVYKALSLTISETMSAEQIWLYLISPETHNEYKTQLDIYIPLFNGIRQSTFVTTIMGLSKFSDSQNNALNAQILFELLLGVGTDSNEVEGLLIKYKGCEATWEKIMKIRHNVFAHISASIREDEAFTMVGITPNEISSAVKVAHEILVSAGNLLGAPSLELTFDPKSTARDISKLFRNLKAGREARLKTSA